jgi:hypothetical protein
MMLAFEAPTMAADSEKDTSKVVVQTYLPAYQREEWDAHADELDMSRSEFVKAMVQAGRRGFEGQPAPEPAPAVSEPPSSEASSDDSSGAAGESLEETVVDALADAEYLSWDELLAAVTDDIETRLEEALQALQADDRVRYSGRHGGYTLDS